MQHYLACGIGLHCGVLSQEEFDQAYKSYEGLFESYCEDGYGDRQSMSLILVKVYGDFDVSEFNKAIDVDSIPWSQAQMAYAIEILNKIGLTHHLHNIRRLVYSYEC